MGELWHDLTELLRKHPVLWLPVLIADLLGSLVNLARAATLHAILFSDTKTQSVLGGPVQHQLTQAALQRTELWGIPVTWISYFLRLLFYAVALVATAALVRGFLERAAKAAAEIGPALRRHAGGIFELAFRALAVYAVAAVLMSMLARYLARHGHTAILKDPWFVLGSGLLVALIQAALLAPVAVRVLSGRDPGESISRVSQQFAFVLVFVAALLGVFVGTDSRALANMPPGARIPLEITGSLLVALPYVLMFVGIALLGVKSAASGGEHTEP